MLSETRPMKTDGGVLALMAALVLLSAAPAEAALQLKLYDGTDTILIEDQDFTPILPLTDPDGSGTLGWILYADVFNG